MQYLIYLIPIAVVIGLGFKVRQITRVLEVEDKDPVRDIHLSVFDPGVRNPRSPWPRDWR